MKRKNIQIWLKFSVAAILLSLLFFQCSSSKKNAAINADDVKNMINNKQFVFTATRVNPLRGRSRFLTSEYDVRINKDSLVSYLPYFGRAYQAPVDPSQGGIRFTSTQFSYEINDTGKNGWDVMIKPQDNQDVQQLLFRIYGNGSATLNVISTQKDAISFDGNIEPLQKE